MKPNIPNEAVMKHYREESVDVPSRDDFSKEEHEHQSSPIRNDVELNGQPRLMLASSTPIDTEVRVKAILIAKLPGGRARGGILGAAVAARVLALREDTVRGWVKREDAIMEEAQQMGIDIEVLSEGLPKIYPPPAHLLANSNLSPAIEEELKDWIVSYLEVSKTKTIHYSYAVKKARELYPHFMPGPSDVASNEERTAYANRARNWFTRFCQRNCIEVLKASKGGNHGRQAMTFTCDYKLRAIEMVREPVEGGRGPDGTRGKKAVARMLGISTHAIRNWEAKEEQLHTESMVWKGRAASKSTNSNSHALPSTSISTTSSSIEDASKYPTGVTESLTALARTNYSVPPYLSAWQTLSMVNKRGNVERGTLEKREHDLNEKLHQHLGLRYQGGRNEVISPKAV